MIQNKALFLIAIPSNTPKTINHNQAVHDPSIMEEALFNLIESWVNYADQYRNTHNYPLDYFAGQFWKDTAMNLLAFIKLSASTRIDKEVLRGIIYLECKRNNLELKPDLLP